jgi:NAD(P)-dependent dehydrogenase (short-subunit alcohol dehydrogenase family)
LSHSPQTHGSRVGGALLDGSVAVVTGAASARGIGRGIATLFSEHGARVAVLDLDYEAACAVAGQLPGDGTGVRCDVTDPGEVQRALEAVAAEFGAPDILVNNAGITSPARLQDIGLDEYRRVMDVNLTGTWLCSQAVVPYMVERGGGSIISMSSVSAKQGGGVFGGAHYTAAKAGVMGLTRALARELAVHRIRANAVAPGFIDTDIRGDAMPAEVEAGIIAGIPLGRAGTPEDVARACLFLASDLSDWITGETMDVNGGAYID